MKWIFPILFLFLAIQAEAQPAAVQFFPDSGVFTGKVYVKLTCTTSGATIRYTTDDTPPTESDASLNSGDSLLVEGTRIIRAKAFLAGIGGDEAGEKYLILGKVAAGNTHSFALFADGTLWTWDGITGPSSVSGVAPARPFRKSSPLSLRPFSLRPSASHRPSLDWNRFVVEV